MQFVGRFIHSPNVIHTDSYTNEEIRKELHLKNIARQLIDMNIHDACMVYDIRGRYIKTVSEKTYTPLELYGF